MTGHPYFSVKSLTVTFLECGLVAVVHSLGHRSHRTSFHQIPACVPTEGRGVQRSERRAVFCRPTHLLVDRIRICIGAENGGHRELIDATKEFVRFEFMILYPSD